MALILNIDTALETASVCLSKDEQLLISKTNNNQKDHAAWLQVAIYDLMKESQYKLEDLDAIAVTIGPGSYTGLRVGLSSAKGLCYALKKPLITIGTLEMMANAAKDEDADLLCPMIDARRMEVFTAVYNKKLEEIVKPHALIPDSNSFSELLASNKIIFFGSGSEKIKILLFHDNAVFKTINYSAADMIVLSRKRFRDSNFADLAYAEPTYLKEFFSPPRKPIV